MFADRSIDHNFSVDVRCEEIKLFRDKVQVLVSIDTKNSAFPRFHSIFGIQNISIYSDAIRKISHENRRKSGAKPRQKQNHAF